MSPLTIRLRPARLKRGWSQAELARRAKLRQATISKYERGSLRSIDLGVLEKLAKALGVPPKALLR